MLRHYINLRHADPDTGVEGLVWLTTIEDADHTVCSYGPSKEGLESAVRDGQQLARNWKYPFEGVPTMNVPERQQTIDRLVVRRIDTLRNQEIDYGVQRAKTFAVFIAAGLTEDEADEAADRVMDAISIPVS